MFLAIAVALTLGLTLAMSVLLAWLVVRTPRLGVGKHPVASLVAAALGLALAIAALVVLVGAPVVFRMAGSEWWGYTVDDYFLATTHRLFNTGYDFWWTPRWIYVVGGVTPLVAVGACLALVAGLAARPKARRTAAVIVGVACCLLAAYVAAGVYATIAAIVTRGVVLG